MRDFQSFQPFQPYLFPGERIVWTGQPKQGIAFSRYDALAIPFSLFWGGFAIFWNVQVWTSFANMDDWFLKLWGLPFLAVGLYLIAGRFFYDAWVRRHQLYAVTNQRVLVLRDEFSTKLIARDIRSLPMLEFTEHRDGRGTIVFDADDVGYCWLNRGRSFNFWSPAASSTSQFFRIDNPRRVYDLIRNQAYD